MSGKEERESWGEGGERGARSTRPVVMRTASIPGDQATCKVCASGGIQE